MNELGRNGFVDVQLAPEGTWALSTVLGCLSTPVPVAAVHGVTVINGQGAPETGPGSMLTPADLAPQGSTDFNNPQEAPVVQALGSLNQYDRPWRGGGQGQPDYDFLDEVQGTDNGQPLPIAIEVFEGPLLTVTVSASRTTVPAGGTVTFNATVTGQNGSALSYSWSFDGGAQSSTAPSPQVTFGNAGQYDVTVQVTDSSGGGGSAEIPITVGAPPPAATGSHPQTGSGKSRKSHTPSGPRKSKGTHAGGPAGKSNTGKSTTAGKGSSTNTGKNTSTTSSTTSTSTTPASTTPSSTTGASTHHATASTSRRASTPHRAVGHTTAPLTRSTPPLPSGPLVSGQLVSDVTPLAAGASPLVRVVPAAVATAPPRARRSGRRYCRRSAPDLRSSCCWVSEPGASCAGAVAVRRSASAAEILVVITALPVIYALSTNGIDQAIFHVANALEVPVLILALAALALVIYELGSYVVEVATRRGRRFSTLQVGARAGAQRTAGG